MDAKAAKAAKDYGSVSIAGCCHPERQRGIYCASIVSWPRGTQRRSLAVARDDKQHWGFLPVLGALRVLGVLCGRLSKPYHDD